MFDTWDLQLKNCFAYPLEFCPHNTDMDVSSSALYYKYSDQGMAPKPHFLCLCPASSGQVPVKPNGL